MFRINFDERWFFLAATELQQLIRSAKLRICKFLPFLAKAA